MGIQSYLNPEGNIMFTKINVIFSTDCKDNIQYRFPKTNKKRIRKKWSKDNKNYRRWPSKNMKIIGMVEDGGVIALAHPVILNFLKELNSKRTSDNDPEFIFDHEYKIKEGL